MEDAKLIDLESVNQLALNHEERDNTKAFFDAQQDARTCLDKIETYNIERMVFVRPMQNVLREDVVSEPYMREALQENAPETMDGYWQVPRVVE